MSENFQVYGWDGDDTAGNSPTKAMCTDMWEGFSCFVTPQKVIFSLFDRS